MREERRFFKLLRCLRRLRLEEPEDSSDELEGELLGLYDRSDSSGSLEVLEDSLEDSLEDEELEEEPPGGGLDELDPELELELELLEEDSLGIPRRVRPMKLPGSSCEMGWGMDFPARR